MARIEHTIEVNVPLHAAYNQWTQFEEFPRFMEGVREVKQLDDAHLHWRVDRNGREMEWDSEITDQVPDHHIAWRDTTGPGNSGSVNFYPVEEDKTRIQLVMETHPDVAPSDMAWAELTTSQRVEQDLARFKRLLEAQGGESGAWRGEIHYAQPAISDDNASQSASFTGVNNDQKQSADGNQSKPDSSRVAEVKEAGQSIFAQQTSPNPPESPHLTPTELSSVLVESDRQTKGDADPRTATLDNKSGTAGVGEHSTGGIEGMQGSRTDEAAHQKTDTSDKQGGSQTWIPNILQGWEEPMTKMKKMAEEMDQLFERFVGRPISNRTSQGGATDKWMPAIEVSQQENQLHVCVDVPGIKKEDIHIEVVHDKLAIEGERHEQRREAAQGYRRSERSYGRFYRMIPLPSGVDPDSVKATMQDGVLEIIVPLPSSSGQQGRRINIQP